MLIVSWALNQRMVQPTTIPSQNKLFEIKIGIKSVSFGLAIWPF